MSNSPSRSSTKTVRIAGAVVPSEYLQDPVILKQQQKAEAAAQKFQASVAKMRERDRQNLTRRHIVLGAAVERLFKESGRWPEAIAALDAHLTKPSERALFEELVGLDHERKVGDAAQSSSGSAAANIDQSSDNPPVIEQVANGPVTVDDSVSARPFKILPTSSKFTTPPPVVPPAMSRIVPTMSKVTLGEI